MSKRPPCVLMFLLVLLRVLGTTDAFDCSASTTYCSCVGLNLTRLGNVQGLTLDGNNIMNVQAGTFNSTPQLCDCGMVPFKLKMTGSYPFEDQINCSQPDHLTGLKLKNVKLEKLFSDCVEPTIVRFERDDSKVSVQGGNLQLVCEASGFPTPDITVIPPSGLNATAESGGRITVEVNGAITITRVTAADVGLYVCIASNPVGSTFVVFSTGVISSRSFPLPVFAGSLCGAVAGTLLIVAIVLTICKTCTRIRSESSAADPNVVLSTLLPQRQGEGPSTSDD
ncbi:hypothetical protein Bbelb_357170 [Branchiostoma belcheri]|nr:hypothetical protein Bbelb_357170 [Branchiostoma belcheri]